MSYAAADSLQSTELRSFFEVFTEIMQCTADGKGADGWKNDDVFLDVMSVIGVWHQIVLLPMMMGMSRNMSTT